MNTPHPVHLTDARYHKELRAALVVHPHGPGLRDADDRAAAWQELRNARANVEAA
jgi:hypothetical protein